MPMPLAVVSTSACEAAVAMSTKASVSHAFVPGTILLQNRLICARGGSQSTANEQQHQHVSKLKLLK